MLAETLVTAGILLILVTPQDGVFVVRDGQVIQEPAGYTAYWRSEQGELILTANHRPRSFLKCRVAGEVPGCGQVLSCVGGFGGEKGEP